MRYVARKAGGWLLMIAVATNATYFPTSWFPDPRSNNQELRPARSEEQIARSLARYNLGPGAPLVRRWRNWLTAGGRWRGGAAGRVATAGARSW
ncbi:hypothetical protein [Streptomyces buecherae]|uniref:hypothetical protein n=1 Tax=Streptomyces buecherae TaxID=2763006 RepID=UPI001E396951|nr:hypothetical protein [Streptomyces buecherae]